MGKKLSKASRFDESHKPRKIQRPPQVLALILYTRFSRRPTPVSNG